jgi:putative transposase
MTRLARHYVPEQPQHVILQGLTGPAFLDEGDYLYFIACLADAARVAGLAVSPSGIKEPGISGI